MIILHTSDWHLGKHLEGKSRLDEQEKFIDELIDIVEKENVDLIIIAGDIYDTYNPPARAERLFYNAIKKLSNDGERLVLVIAGNHDNPERLEAVSPLCYENGVIIKGLFNNEILLGEHKGFKVIKSNEGFVEVEIKGERAVILTLPYPSEKRMNEIFSNSLEEKDRQASYSERIKEIFDNLKKNYREDTINIAVSHLFVLGADESDSERPIQLGGSLAVNLNDLPDNAQYIALGHLHKPQKFLEKNVYYSGSPIQYSKSEINYSKCVFIVDIKPGSKAKVKEVLLSNYKPIEVFKAKSIEEAINICKENKERDIWAYFEIETDRVLEQSEIKKMKELLPDIIEIKPIIKNSNDDDNEDFEVNERKMIDLFKDYYETKYQVKATDKLLDLFMEITNDLEEEVRNSEAN